MRSVFDDVMDVHEIERDNMRKIGNMVAKINNGEYDAPNSEELRIAMTWFEDQKVLFTMETGNIVINPIHCAAIWFTND